MNSRAKCAEYPSLGRPWLDNACAVPTRLLAAASAAHSTLKLCWVDDTGAHRTQRQGLQQLFPWRWIWRSSFCFVSVLTVLAGVTTHATGRRPKEDAGHLGFLSISHGLGLSLCFGFRIWRRNSRSLSSRRGRWRRFAMLWKQERLWP